MARLEQLKAASVRHIVGPTIMLGSGTYFDFAEPENSALTVEDFAYGLAAACRFAGQSVSRVTGKRVFYTVAEHCVRMSYAVPAGFEYDALMHEAGEPTCGDMVGPLKSLCHDYKAIEKRCERANFERFKVRMSDPDLIKLYDLRMLATEKRDLVASADRDQWAWAQGAQPLDFQIVPWGQHEAAERFIERYVELAPAGAPRPTSKERPSPPDFGPGRWA
ncbi:MAG TPA: hypothetical protein VFJ46_17740 [Xanthobacteraceae bacterium]|nr:hypothetical protein [Xanthobacteraceae bacterium]